MKAVNLIPSDQRASRVGAGRSEGGAYAVLAVLGGLAVLALLYGMAHNQISSRRARAASLSAGAQRAQAAAAQLAPYTSFMALREQRTNAVLALVNSRFDWAHAFHELGRVLPRDASISSLTGTISSVSAVAPAGGSAGAAAGASTSTSAGATPAATSASVTSATPPGSVPTFTLDGCATSQAEVARTLERLRLIDGVSEVTLQSSTESSAGSGSAGSGSAGCAAREPAFAVQVAFDPLPALPATGPSPAVLTTASGGAG
jgi:Tfp pilus assembly protein PilN